MIQRGHLYFRAHPGEKGARPTPKSVENLLILASEDLNETFRAIEAWNPDPPAAEADPDPEPLEAVFAVRLAHGR